MFWLKKSEGRSLRQVARRWENGEGTHPLTVRTILAGVRPKCTNDNAVGQPAAPSQTRTGPKRAQGRSAAAQDELPRAPQYLVADAELPLRGLNLTAKTPRVDRITSRWPETG